MAKWPYNTQRWQRLRKLHLAKSPLCVYCERMGKMELATTVDHVTPIRDGGAPFDGANLQSLCTTHHSATKQREDRGGEAVGCDTDGIPLRGWE